MLLLLVLLQTAQPDIALYARARAREVTIEKQGEARLTVTADPDGGNRVDVIAPRANGRRTLRNVEVIVRGEARIAEPGRGRSPTQINQDEPETSPPQ